MTTQELDGDLLEHLLKEWETDGALKQASQVREILSVSRIPREELYRLLLTEADMTIKRLAHEMGRTAVRIGSILREVLLPPGRRIPKATQTTGKLIP